MAFLPTLDRRAFTLQSALALLGGVTITVAACGGSGSAPTGASPTASSPPGNAGLVDLPGSISSNHGHTAVISAAQLAASQAIQLTITGTASHPHMVELTAADLARLGGNESVSKDSSTTAGHHHVVTFSRSGTPPGPGY